jgi:hypothetical protein
MSCAILVSDTATTFSAPEARQRVAVGLRLGGRGRLDLELGLPGELAADLSATSGGC